MDPIELLPNVDIKPIGPVSQKFLERSVDTLHEACYFVKDMEYGFNSSRTDSLIIFEENKGTCITKHGTIARLAGEYNLPITKCIGIYRLTDTIVTGVNQILKQHDIPFLPQVHCFLKYRSFRVDLTEGNCNGKNTSIEEYDFTFPVQPDIPEEEELEYYLDYLDNYFDWEPGLKRLGKEKVLELLARCNNLLQNKCSLAA